MVKKNQSLGLIKLKNFYKSNKFILFFLFFLFVIILLVLIFSSSNQISNEDLIYGDDMVEMYYFHMNTCPHCHTQKRFMISNLIPKYPNLKIYEYEMSVGGSLDKYKELAEKIEGLDPNSFPGTPLTIIGDKYNIGFGSAETSGVIIENLILGELEKINLNWSDDKIRTIDLR